MVRQLDKIKPTPSKIVKDNQISKEEIILKDSGRIRNVIQGPDESLYVSVEGPGRIIKITPRWKS